MTNSMKETNSLFTRGDALKKFLLVIGAFFVILSVASVFIPRHEAHAGWGRCGISGCNCPAYQGNADLCGNCGHNYASHW